MLAPLKADQDDNAGATQLLPTGQRITPTAATAALFQQLDPDSQPILLSRRHGRDHGREP